MRGMLNVVRRPVLLCRVVVPFVNSVSNAPRTSFLFFSFTRDEVLRKALPVFWKQGFARASLPDPEHATGVNKSGLYAEFQSKEKLYLECLRYYLNDRDGADFLAGGGEMGARIREHDWAASRRGPADALAAEPPVRGQHPASVPGPGGALLGSGVHRDLQRRLRAGVRRQAPVLQSAPFPALTSPAAAP